VSKESSSKRQQHDSDFAKEDTSLTQPKQACSSISVDKDLDTNVGVGLDFIHGVVNDAFQPSEESGDIVVG
jgi:hypothetical protein